MDKVQKTISSQWYIPSSEPFRIYSSVLFCTYGHNGCKSVHLYVRPITFSIFAYNVRHPPRRLANDFRHFTHTDT